jgi:excinuclease ABC subunit C
LTLSRDLNVKRSLGSFLEDVPGVGPARRKALLEHFEGLEGLKEASVEEIRAVPGISPALAESLYQRLREEAEDPDPDHLAQ